MKKKCRQVVPLLIIVLCISVTNIQAAIFTTTPLRTQEKSKWCWAASAQMLLETRQQYTVYSQKLAKQVHIADAKPPGDANPPFTNSSEDKPLILSQIKAKMSYITAVQYDTYERSLSFSEVKGGINGGWAIGALLFSNKKNLGHMVVFTGYDSGISPQGISWNNVFMEDPRGDPRKNNITGKIEGREGWVNYNAIKGDDGYGYSSWFDYYSGEGYKWLQSIY